MQLLTFMLRRNTDVSASRTATGYILQLRTSHVVVELLLKIDKQFDIDPKLFKHLQLHLL